MEDSKNKKENLGILSIIILIISTIIIVFSFFAPKLFIKETNTGIDFTNTGQIGDTIGGIMNPFIAIAGVLLTFLAFYIQFKANKLQRELFRSELNEQNEQFKKTQFENQFYEMLRLHKENANEISINLLKIISNNRQREFIENTIRGRQVFEYLIHEFELCYNIAKKSFPDQNYKIWINEAYGVFFHGINNKIKKKHAFFKLIDSFKKDHEDFKYSNLSSIVESKLKMNWEYELNYPIFKGYSWQLAHYFRHLYQTVKFIANQSEKFITYEEKRNYLRILRAQLSNQEQALLFYNWLSNFGKHWENETNKFFTDYRIIHNVYPDILVEDIVIEELFDFNGNFKKEKDRAFDPLFEFQDWY